MLSDSPAFWAAAWTWVRAVLEGMGEPWVIALVLAATTLLVEDLAIAAGVALAAQGAISWPLSFAAVGGGIALGDLGLYALGLGATRMPWLRHRFVDAKASWARERLANGLASAVLLARVIPGLRLATYVASGFVRVPFLPFTGWVLLAVTLWTAGLYAVSFALGQALMMTLGLPAPVAVALPIIVLALAVPLVRAARRRPPGAHA